MVFTVHDAGFYARCALEAQDSSQNRLDKIMGIVASCRYGIHDLSRTEVNSAGLPRFNMPLELGIFLGAKRFGGRKHKTKCCLVLDREPYRYQQFVSDIAGQDIAAHALEPRQAVRRIRDWLKTASQRTTIPGAATIWRHFEGYQQALPRMCAAIGTDVSALTFVDTTQLISAWLAENVP